MNTEPSAPRPADDPKQNAELRDILSADAPQKPVAAPRPAWVDEAALLQDIYKFLERVADEPALTDQARALRDRIYEIFHRPSEMVREDER